MMDYFGLLESIGSSFSPDLKFPTTISPTIFFSTTLSPVLLVFLMAQTLHILLLPYKSLNFCSWFCFIFPIFFSFFRSNSLSSSSSLLGRRQWHPTPVLLPGKSHGWRSLVGCIPWGRTESDITEVT